MSIGQQIDELLNQIDELMQELIKNHVPCEEMIKKVIAKLGSAGYYPYITDVSVDVFTSPRHHWVCLRRLPIPIAIDGKDTTTLSLVTIEIGNAYWWSASYAEQLIIMNTLPKLLEKVMERVRQGCIIAPTTIMFDFVRPPAVKHHWWKFWRK